MKDHERYHETQSWKAKILKSSPSRSCHEGWLGSQTTRTKHNLWPSPTGIQAREIPSNWVETTQHALLICLLHIYHHMLICHWPVHNMKTQVFDLWIKRHVLHTQDIQKYRSCNNTIPSNNYFRLYISIKSFPFSCAISPRFGTCSCTKCTSSLPFIPSKTDTWNLSTNVVCSRAGWLDRERTMDFCNQLKIAVLEFPCTSRVNWAGRIDMTKMDLSSSKWKILNGLNSFRCILESLPEKYCENMLRKRTEEPWPEATVGIIYIACWNCMELSNLC